MRSYHQWLKAKKNVKSCVACLIAGCDSNIPSNIPAKATWIEQHRCTATFEAKTGEGIKGACVDYPKASVPYEQEAGRIYTQTIFVGQREMLHPGFVDEFRKQIRSVSKYTDNGLVKWVTLSEVIQI